MSKPAVGEVTVKDVTKSANQLLWKMHELETSLSDPENTSPDLLEQRLLEYHARISETAALLAAGGAGAPDGQRTLQGRDMPLQLVRCLDLGINPDEFLRETLKACVRDNQLVKGRAEAFSSLAAQLRAQAAELFPEQERAFRRLTEGNK